MKLSDHKTSPARNGTQAFTLIEMSIVIVIIGLLVGAIIIGKNLVISAGVRAQIVQIQGYNTAVAQFVNKYGYLPGDIPANVVTNLGFTVVPTRAGTQGQGDGDGLIQGYGYAGEGSASTICCTSGETAWFWEDLSSNAGLIEGAFSYAGTAALPTSIPGYGDMQPNSTPSIDLIIPKAKIGKGNYINVYNYNGLNYFDLSATSNLDGNGAVRTTNPGLSVQQAYDIDKKIDDGMPQTGFVLAMYQAWNLSTSIVWANGPGGSGTYGTTATSPTTTSCFDNGGTAGVQHYSLSSSINSTNTNCALSFQFAQ